MLHCSTQTYQQPSSKREKDSQIKQVGSYFQQPLVQQVVSTKQNSMRHVFRTVAFQPLKGENIFCSMNGFSGSIKIINAEALGSQARKVFRKHIRMQIKEYLQRKYQKPTFLIPLQSFECLRTLDPKKPQYTKTSGLMLFKPYFLNGNIKLLLDKGANQIQNLSLHNIFIQLLKVSVEFGGLDNFIMTTSNVYFQDDLETLQINYTSMVGLSMIKANQNIDRHQFFEIQPHLTMEICQKNEIGKTTKIRSFLVVALTLCIEYDLYFPQEGYIKEGGIDIKFISGDKFHEGIKDLLVQIIFDSQTAIKKASKRINKEMGRDKKQFKGNRFKLQQFFLHILKNEDNLQWEYIIDNLSYMKPRNPPKNAEQIENKFKEFHKYLWQKQKDKQFYEKRGLSGERMYIPIKYQGVLNEIFKFKNWWQIFLDDKFNFLQQNFCLKLISEKIKEYQNRQSQFSQDLIVKTIMRHLMKSNLPILSKIKDQTHEKQMKFVRITQRFKDFFNYLKRDENSQDQE